MSPSRPGSPPYSASHQQLAEEGLAAAASANAEEFTHFEIGVLNALTGIGHAILTLAEIQKRK